MDQPIDPQLANAQTVKGGPPPTYGGAQGAASRLEQEIKKGRYDINDAEELGEGGMGMVRAIKDRALRRKVAMKVLKGKQHTNYLECRLILEACITGILEHPGIVPVHDLGTLPVENSDHANVFFTMKKVDGHDLEKIIRLLRTPEARLEPKERGLASEIRDRFGSIPARLGLFLKVCDALAFAHGGVEGLQIIHRDLKPANIMVGAYGEVLVMDWGLAKPLGSSDLAEELRQRRADLLAIEGSNHVKDLGATQDGAFVGTWHFAPPEQIEGRIDDIETRTDVYALGGLLYSLLTLDLPLSIPEKTPPTEVKSFVLGIIEKGKTVPLARAAPREGKPAIPEALRPVILKALESKTEDRMDTVVELQKAVSDYLAGFANAFENASLWRHAIYFVKRHMAACITTLSALFVIAILTMWFVLQVTAESRRADKERDLAKAETSRANTEATLKTKERNKAMDLIAAASQKSWGAARQALDSLNSPDEEIGLARLAEAFRYDQSLPIERRSSGLKEDAANRLIRLPPPLLLPDKLDLHHRGRVFHAEYSPDGGRIVSVCKDKVVRIWDAKNEGSPITTFPLPNEVLSARFTEDSDHILAVSDEACFLLSIDSHSERLIPASHFISPPRGLSSSNWNFLPAIKNQTELQVINAANASPFGEPLRLDIQVPGNSKSYTLDLANAFISPDGMYAITVEATIHPNFRLWEIKTGKQLGPHFSIQDVLKNALSDASWKELSNPMVDPVGCWSVEFSPSRRRLAAFCGGWGILCQARPFKPTGNLIFHPDGICLGSFSNDGKRILTAGFNHTIRLWDVETGYAICKPIQIDSELQSACWTPHPPSILCTNDSNRAYVLNLETLDPRGLALRHGYPVNSAEFDASGRLVVASDDFTVRVWNVSDGSEKFEPLEDNSRDNGQIVASRFSPDGNMLLTAKDSKIRLWNSSNAKKFGEIDIGCTIVDALFDPTSKLVAACGRNGTVALWDVKTATPTDIVISHLNVQDVQFSPNGRLLATTGGDQVTRLWDASTGSKVGSDFVHHNTAVEQKGRMRRRAIFSPDGNHFATVPGAREVKVWNIPTGKEVLSLLKHSDAVTSCAFSANGMLIVTGSFDGTAIIWDASSGAAIHTLQHLDTVIDAKFSPDGRRVITSSADSSAQVWDVESGKPLGGPLRHNKLVVASQFSTDNTRIVTASGDGTARLWDWIRAEEVGDIAPAIECFAETTIDLDGQVQGQSLLHRYEFVASLLRERSEADQVPNFLRWRFSPPFARSVSPLSQLSSTRDVSRDIEWVLFDGDYRHSEIRNKAELRMEPTTDVASKAAPASTLLLQAYAKDPGHPLIHIAMARLEVMGPQEFYREYGLSRLPEDAATCIQAAKMLLQANDKLRAHQAAEKALRIDPQNVEAQPLIFEASK